MKKAPFLLGFLISCTTTYAEIHSFCYSYPINGITLKHKPDCATEPYFSFCTLRLPLFFSQESSYKPLQRPAPEGFDNQLDVILAAAPDGFASIRGAEIKKDMGAFAAFATPEFETLVPLEGSVSAVIMQDRFNTVSWIARYASYSDEAEAQKQFAVIENKLRKHAPYPFGEAKFTPVRDARGTLFYVEPKSPSDARYKGLVLTLALMKGLEKVNGKLEERYQTTLTINYK